MTWQEIRTLTGATKDQILYWTYSTESEFKLGDWVIRHRKHGRGNAYEIIKEGKRLERPKPFSRHPKHDPDKCAVCGCQLTRNRALVVNRIKHCAGCNKRAFIDQVPSVRDKLRLNEVVQ